MLGKRMVNNIESNRQVKKKTTLSLFIDIIVNINKSTSLAEIKTATPDPTSADLLYPQLILTAQEIIFLIDEKH